MHISPLRKNIPLTVVTLAALGIMFFLFFMHPTSATPLDVLPQCVGDGAKFPPITAGAFLAERLREIGLKT